MRWTSYLLAGALGVGLALVLLAMTAAVSNVPRAVRVPQPESVLPPSPVKPVTSLQQKTQVVRQARELPTASTKRSATDTPRHNQPQKLPPSVDQVRDQSQYRNLDAAGMVKMFGGNDVATVLRSPQRAVSVLLASSIHERDAQRLKPRTREGNVPPETADRLATVLLDPLQNRQVDATKPCAPLYGWKVSYFADWQQVDLYVCFECAILHVMTGGKIVGGCHIDEIEGDLLEIALALHPNDAALLEVQAEQTRRREAIAKLSQQSAAAPLTQTPAAQTLPAESPLPQDDLQPARRAAE